MTSFLSDSSILCIIIIIMSSAFDFWTVKNVSGRLLVGLKWWSKREPDGSEKWCHECRVDESKNNLVDTSFFWIG